jgi:23S rRNA pseudouridine1911/1915/1917 synthase
MLVARTADSYSRLVRMFARREVDKRYLAIVWGTPKGASGTIEAPIGRHPRERQRMAVVRAGRPATTRWRVVESAAGVALLELELLTGRTHQIRVHVRHLGHPLVGDPVYGEARERRLGTEAARRLGAFSRPALHARRLALAHPVTGAPLEIVAPVAPDLVALWCDSTGRPWPSSC